MSLPNWMSYRLHKKEATFSTVKELQRIEPSLLSGESEAVAANGMRHEQDFASIPESSETSPNGDYDELHNKVHQEIRNERSSSTSSNVNGPSQDATEAPVDSHRKRVCSLYVTVCTHDQVLENLSSEAAVEALREIHNQGLAISMDMAGVFEQSSGASFYIHWVTEGPDYAEVYSAMNCALTLRRDFVRWNEARKVDGVPPLTLVMGLDWGSALLGEIGPVHQRRSSFVGDVVNRARTLSQVAVSVGTDFLVSDQLWSAISHDYLGEPMAEVSLGAGGGLRSCFRVDGYRDEKGQEVWIAGPSVEPGLGQKGLSSLSVSEPVIQEALKARRWMVNNGNHILGPLTASDVAKQLFTLDLDFDCECWEEGKGNRLTIGRSTLFGVYEEEPGESYWVFDGENVHGPLTEGFVRTGLLHGAFPPEAMLCRESTINGWQALNVWVSKKNETLEAA